MINTALGWMVLAQVFFAGMNVCTRLGARHLPWSEIAATRFLIGALIAFGLAKVRGSSLRITDRPNTWRRSLFGTSAAMCSFYALASSRIAVGDAATLTATAPIFVALLSGPVLGERVGGRVALAIALGFGGIVAIVLHFSLVALAITVAVAIPVWQSPDWRSGLLLVGVGLTGGGGQMAMTRAYSLHRAAPVTALSGLGIVLTHLFAIPVFGDRPTGWQLAGSLLVIAASALLAAPEPGVSRARVSG